MVLKKWTTFKYRLELWPPDVRHAIPLGLNEADLIKSSSIPIYCITKQKIYTQNGWPDIRIDKWNLMKLGQLKVGKE